LPRSAFPKGFDTARLAARVVHLTRISECANIIGANIEMPKQPNLAKEFLWETVVPSKAPNPKQTNKATQKRGPAKPGAQEPLARTEPVSSLADSVRRAVAHSRALRPSDVLALQRAIGNQTVTHLLGRASASSAPRIQFRLTVGAEGDQYEQEADCAANQVMDMPAADVSSPSTAGEVETESRPIRQQTMGSGADGRVSGVIQRESYDKTWESSSLGSWWYGVGQKKAKLQTHFQAIRDQLALADKALKSAPKDREAFGLSEDGRQLKALRDYENKAISWNDADALIAGAEAKLAAAVELVEKIPVALNTLKEQREKAEALEKTRKREAQQRIQEQQRLARESQRVKQQAEEERQRKEAEAIAAKREEIQKVLPPPNYGACLNKCGGDLDVLLALTKHIKLGEGGLLLSSLGQTDANQLLKILQVHNSPIDIVNKLLAKLGKGKGDVLEELLGKIEKGQEPALLKLLNTFDPDRPNPTKVGELLDVDDATAPKLITLLETEKVLAADLYKYLVTENVPINKLETVLQSCTAVQLKDLFDRGKLGVLGATGKDAVNNIIEALGKLGGDAATLQDLMKKHSGLVAATMLRIVGAHVSAGAWDPSVASVSMILYHYKKHVIDEGDGGGPGAKDVEGFSADTAGPVAKWHTGYLSQKGDGWKIPGPPGGTYDLVTRKPFTFWYV
jgi:hypothetical protein